MIRFNTFLLTTCLAATIQAPTTAGESEGGADRHAAGAIEMKNIRNEAIVINTNYGAWMATKNGKAHPVFRDIIIKDISCNGAKAAVRMVGTSHQPIRNITLENVSIKASSGMRFDWVHGLKLIHVESVPSEGEPLRLANCKDVKQ